jgi:hypothetical protein
MNFDEVVHAGHSPWAPSPYAHDLEPWSIDDIPTLGTFMHREQRMLFSVVVDAEGPLTVWVYTRLSAPQEATADALSGRALMDWAEQALSDADVLVFGFAHEWALERYALNETRLESPDQAYYLKRAIEALAQYTQVLRPVPPEERFAEMMVLAERQRVETHPTEEAQASGLICIG